MNVKVVESPVWPLALTRSRAVPGVPPEITCAVEPAL